MIATERTGYGFGGIGLGAERVAVVGGRTRLDGWVEVHYLGGVLRAKGQGHVDHVGTRRLYVGLCKV